MNADLVWLISGTLIQNFVPYKLFFESKSVTDAQMQAFYEIFF